jgi:D-glycero-D-manno-heptose 1,7-bisphosphate phosphatase
MKFVILDRDGVINFDSDAYIKSVEEWQPIPGSIDAIAALSRAGFEVVVATNQSGLSRGLFGLDELEAMHAKLRALVEERGGHVGGIFYCPHLPEEHCGCRKPATGLLDAVEQEYGCEVSGSILVGDSLKDIELARRKGCTPVLVLTGNGATTRARLDDTTDVRVFDDLAAAAAALLDGKLDGTC